MLQVAQKFIYSEVQLLLLMVQILQVFILQITLELPVLLLEAEEMAALGVDRLNRHLSYFPLAPMVGRHLRRE